MKRVVKGFMHKVCTEYMSIVHVQCLMILEGTWRGKATLVP